MFYKELSIICNKVLYECENRFNFQIENDNAI